MIENPPFDTEEITFIDQDCLSTESVTDSSFVAVISNLEQENKELLDKIQHLKEEMVKIVSSTRSLIKTSEKNILINKQLTTQSTQLKNNRVFFILVALDYMNWLQKYMNENHEPENYVNNLNERHNKATEIINTLKAMIANEISMNNVAFAERNSLNESISPDSSTNHEEDKNAIDVALSSNQTTTQQQFEDVIVLSSYATEIETLKQHNKDLELEHISLTQLHNQLQSEYIDCLTLTSQHIGLNDLIKTQNANLNKQIHFYLEVTFDYLDRLLVMHNDFSEESYRRTCQKLNELFAVINNEMNTELPITPSILVPLNFQESNTANVARPTAQKPTHSDGQLLARFGMTPTPLRSAQEKRHANNDEDSLEDGSAFKRPRTTA